MSTEIDWDYYDHGPGSEEHKRKMASDKRDFDRRWEEEKRKATANQEAELQRLQGIVDKQRKAIQYVQGWCMSRTAGNTNNPFAWIPQPQWDEFVSQAEAALEQGKLSLPPTEIFYKRAMEQSAEIKAALKQEQTETG